MFGIGYVMTARSSRVYQAIIGAAVAAVLFAAPAVRADETEMENLKARVKRLEQLNERLERQNERLATQTELMERQFDRLLKQQADGREPCHQSKCARIATKSALPPSAPRSKFEWM